MGNLVDQLSQRPQQPLPEPPVSFTEPLGLGENQDPLTSGLVTFAEAENLCRIYRHMSQKHFPCVILPESMGVLGLRQERPMLLQAILVVASWRERPRQMTLEKFYLKDLGVRFFMNGERSLDILQGLLVYLAWYELKAYSFHPHSP